MNNAHVIELINHLIAVTNTRDQEFLKQQLEKLSSLLDIEGDK